MKTIAKMGLVGLALAASSAHADVFLPSTGNGELTLFVRNDTTGVVYARGLQIRLDSVLPQSTVNGTYLGDTSTGLVQQITFALNTVGPDQALAGFLNGTDSFSWTIMAGDNVGTNDASPDARRYLTTTQVVYDESNPLEVNNSNLATTWNNLQAMLTTLNGVIDGTSGADGDGHSTATGGQWRQAGAQPGSIMGNWGGGSSPNTVNALGTAAHLYVLTTAGGGQVGVARVYQGFDVILNTNGSLQAITPPVPLPPAAWMLVSGLLTLAGVGRRKSAAKA